MHRKIVDSFLAKNPKALALWVRLLLEANHKDQEFMFNGKKQICRRGQLLAGRKSLAQKTGLDENSVYRLLKMLEIEHLIEQQKTNKFTLISIKNYAKYQNGEQQIEQQVNNNRTTSEQQVNTNNNVNNDKNVKNGKNTPQAEFVNNWKELYQSETGKPFKERREDFIIVANLLKRFELPEILSRARILFDLCKRRAVWFTKGGMADFTIGKLSSQWNSLIEGVDENGKQVGVSKSELASFMSGRE